MTELSVRPTVDGDEGVFSAEVKTHDPSPLGGSPFQQWRNEAQRKKTAQGYAYDYWRAYWHETTAKEKYGYHGGKYWAKLPSVD